MSLFAAAGLSFETEITKGKISCLDKDSLSIDLQYNPSEVKLARSISWTDEPTYKQPYGLLHFVNGASDKLSFTVLLDESESDKSVLDGVKKYYELTKPLKIEEHNIRPPCIVFLWDKLRFQGVIDSLDVNFLMFDEKGVPKRATIGVSMQGRAFDNAQAAKDFFSQSYTPKS